MVTQLQLGDIAVDVVLKDIKNVHLSVYPPLGRVRIAAPRRMSLETIRGFAIEKLPWIKRQQQKFRAQDRETPREYCNRESHSVWGKRYLLKVIYEDAVPTVILTPRQMILRLRPGAHDYTQEAVVAQWYREQIKAAVPDLLAYWEPKIGVQVARVFVQKMKTQWGSCNPLHYSMRLNTDLAKKPPQCLEYIVVHELMHLRERHHNDRFMALMDEHLPQWRQCRQLLNRTPLGHETWSY